MPFVLSHPPKESPATRQSHIDNPHAIFSPLYLKQNHLIAYMHDEATHSHRMNRITHASTPSPRLERHQRRPISPKHVTQTSSTIRQSRVRAPVTPLPSAMVQESHRAKLPTGTTFTCHSLDTILNRSCLISRRRSPYASGGHKLSYYRSSVPTKKQSQPSLSTDRLTALLADTATSSSTA